MIKQFVCKHHGQRATSICASYNCQHRTICQRTECARLHKHNTYKMSLIFIDDIQNKRQEILNYKKDASQIINTFLSSIEKRFQIIQNNQLNIDSKINHLELEDIPVESVVSFMELDINKSNLKQGVIDITKKLDQQFRKVFHEVQKKSNSQIIGGISNSIQRNSNKHKSDLKIQSKIDLDTKSTITGISTNAAEYSQFLQTKSFVTTINYLYEIDIQSLYKQSRIFRLLNERISPQCMNNLQTNFSNMMFKKKLNINNKKCIYRASEYGFKSDQYKRKILDKAKTFFMVLSKDPQTNQPIILGAYLSKPWQNTFVYDKQCNSFMFQLVNAKIWPLKNSSYPILYSPPKESKQLYGPVFGRFDLCISDSCDKYESFTTSNMSYNIKDYGGIIIEQYEVFGL